MTTEMTKGLERERDEAIALERERCAGLVREIPACQPGAKATPARRWLDDRIAACVRAILSDDETATCARSLVREARERAKAAEADADRLRTDNGRLDDVAKGALDDLARVRAELDATRAALVDAAPWCDTHMCHAPATHWRTARQRAERACDKHAIGDPAWDEDEHAAAVRAAVAR